jgi:hypothetical protein
MLITAPKSARAETALRMACLMNLRHVMDVLLKHGVDPDSVDGVGRNALFYVSPLLPDYEQVMTKLILHGGSAYHKNVNGMTVMHYLYEYSFDGAEELRAKGDIRFVKRATEFLIRAGLNVNIRDDRDRTPLTLARSVPEAQYLKSKGASLALAFRSPDALKTYMQNTDPQLIRYLFHAGLREMRWRGEDVLRIASVFQIKHVLETLVPPTVEAV